MNNDTNNNLGNNTDLNSNVIGGTNIQPETLEPTPASEVMGNQNNNSSFTVMLDANKNDNTLNNPQPNSQVLTPNPSGQVNTENLNPNPNPTPNPTPVEPSPNYTNPQSIMPNLMPGFEDSSVVGQTPPISLNEEKQPKKKNNKIVFILLVIVLICGVGFGLYYVLNNTDLLSKPKINITTKNFNVNIGESLPNDFASYAIINGTQTNNCQKDTTKVNIDVEGVYEFTVSCGDIKKTGTITVIDNRPLVVDSQKVYKVKGENVSANEFAKTIDPNIVYEFKTDVSTLTNTVGTHAVTIKATNKSNNKETEFTGKLIVLEYKTKGYLTCSITNNAAITEPAGTKNVKYRFAIADASVTEPNVYGGLTQEYNEFIITEQEAFDNLVAEFNTNKTITIGNVVGTIDNVEFEASTRKITIVNELDNTALINQYGADVMKTYSNIRNKFNTKDANGNNACEWKKVEN